MFKVSNRNARTMYEICSDLIIKTPKRHHWRRSGVFILNFEQVNVSLVCEARDILLRTKWRKKLTYEKFFSENVFFPMFPIFPKRNNFTVFFSQMNFKYPIQKQPPEVFYKKNSQNSQENICARVSFFIKLQTLKGHTYFKNLHLKVAALFKYVWLRP